jgi:hypothetical protein
MSDNKLELVVEVDVSKANASIKSINTGLSSLEQAAAKAGRGASAGIDGLTVSMVKGATAGNLLADGIKHAIEWMKEGTIGAARSAANTDRMEAVTRSLARVHGEGAAAGSLKAETAALSREVDELRKAVGKEFQASRVTIVHHMRDLVGFLKENSDCIVKFAQGAIFLAGAIPTYGLIAKIMGITTAVEGLAAAGARVGRLKPPHLKTKPFPAPELRPPSAPPPIRAGCSARSADLRRRLLSGTPSGHPSPPGSPDQNHFAPRRG